MELIVSLYDGWMRFLYRAADAAEHNDVIERRFAVKRALDILMYLQARLRMDVGGSVASSLSDFYSAMFTMTLEASHSNSAEDLRQVIGCVRNVREAWVAVARDPAANSVMPRELQTSADRNRRSLPSAVHARPVASASTQGLRLSA